MKYDLLETIEASDSQSAVAAFDKRVSEGGDPWEIHLSLFPTAQRVLNPPYINPHLPKMHAIYRGLAPRIEREDIAGLVRIEVSECARRPKMASTPARGSNSGTSSFDEIASALSGDDPEKTARLMASFAERKGMEELARRILLLGSGYLKESLGHSLSCTAFILIGAMAPGIRDPWPALYTLADYFHRGGFRDMPAMQTEPVSYEEMEGHLLRAASGRGLLNLHHTITIYAIESVSHIVTGEERNHLIRSWIAFMGEKEAQRIPGGDVLTGTLLGYPMFYALAASLDSRATLSGLCTLVHSEKDRARMAKYLIKAVCDLYQGNYNPHYLTGLGPALWVVDRFHESRRIVANALYQYLDFLFTDIEPRLVNPPLDI